MRPEQSKQHLEYLELAFLERDGELSASETRALIDHASRCAECQAVRRGLPALDSALSRAAIEVHPDLARRVMDNLPPAAWEMRRPASWRVAAAAVIGLLAAAYALNLGDSPGAGLPWIATLSAMAELFRSTALAGAGLLAASWTGAGLALGATLARSSLGLVTFGLFVLGVDCLFLRYLWRLNRREALAGRRRSTTSNGSD